MLERCSLVFAAFKHLSGTERTLGGAEPERQSFITSIDDSSYRPFQILQHIFCGQPKHSKSARRQKRIPPHIPSRSISAIMRLTIDFNRQPRFKTGKIQHKLAQRMLPPEFVTTGPFAQFPPDQNFRQVAGSALTPGQLPGIGAGGKHCFPFHLNSLSGLLRKPVSPCRRDIFGSAPPSSTSPERRGRCAQRIRRGLKLHSKPVPLHQLRWSPSPGGGGSARCG